MPRAEFDDVIHEPHRLQICGVLAPVTELGFQAVRDEVELSDSAMSKHTRTLREAGYVWTRREPDGVTVIGLTEPGRHAFCGHIASLQQLARIASVRGRPAWRYTGRA